MNNIERGCLPRSAFFNFKIVFKIMALLLMAGALLSSCSSQHTLDMERKLMYRSLSQRPAWITSLPTDPDYFFTVGISTNTTSLREGRLSAAHDAAVEVSNYLGLKTSSRFEVETTELTTRIVNEMTTTTSARLEQTSLSQMYYEEFHHAGTEEQPNVFDVYVLLRMPMAELLQEQQRRKLKREGILAEVEIIRNEAQQHFNDGDFPLAWQKWILAMRLLDEEVIGSVSSLQIYKTLLTVVEGIDLSIDADSAPATSSSKNKMRGMVIARANYISAGENTALKNLPLHFRLAKDKQAGKIKKTDASGQIKYMFSDAEKKGLEISMMMSPYVVDKIGLSPELSRKIAFLEERLERKSAQYGDIVMVKPNIAKSPFQAVVLTGKEGGLVEVNVATNNAYVLSNSDEKPSLTLKVDIKPMQTESMKRPPLNLSVVLDKSASMYDDDKIGYTKKAAAFLIDNLTPRDYLSIVTYDSDVVVVTPAAPVSFRDLLKHDLAEIEPDGMTNLSGGLFEGYSQVKKYVNAHGINRILLLSDGKANLGITLSEELIPYTEKYAEEGIAVTALGVGQDFNEELMMGLAETSNGNYYYIKNPEDIPGIFSQELSRLVNVAAQNVQVNIKLKEGVRLANSFGHPFNQTTSNEYQFRLGDINYGDRGILLLELDVPWRGDGEINLAAVEVSYDDAGSKGKMKSEEQISAVYTDSAALVASSENLEVEKYVLLTRSIEQLEKILQSMDRGLYSEAVKSLKATYASLESFARASEDPEFLQRMRLLKHFEHEIEELQESNALHEHDESITKKLGYRLYLEKHSHQTLDHPLHPTGR